MSDDNIMYDSPSEFMHDIAQSNGGCVAQSVVPLSDGSYVCACSCENWEVTAADRAEGLRLARLHTGSDHTASPEAEICN